MRKLLLVILIAFLFAAPVYAEGLGLDTSAVEEDLGDEEREISGTLTLDGGYDTEGAISRLLSRLGNELKESAREELKQTTRLIAIAAICAAAEAFCTEKQGAGIISLCACAAACMSTIGSMDGVLTQLNDAITKMYDYSRAALPVVFTAAAAGGAAVSSAAKYAAVCLCTDIIMELGGKITLPLIYAYLAMSVTRAVFPNAIVAEAVSVAKWLAVTVMTAVTIGASAYICIVSTLTGSADAAAVKAVKTLISSSLPVVGGIISDAASAVLASAGVIKSSAGVFALVVVCAISLAPFAAISVKMLAFKACSAVASALEGKRLAVLLGDLSGAFAMLLGMLGSMTIMLFISFMAAIRTVSA